MKSHDAPGFLVIGTVMIFLPTLLPDYFPANGLDGSNTSALWLEVMGIVNNLVGAVLVARAVPAAIARLLAWRPAVQMAPQPVRPVRVMRPAFAPSGSQIIYRGLRPKAERQLAA